MCVCVCMLKKEILFSIQNSNNSGTPEKKKNPCWILHKYLNITKKGGEKGSAKGEFVKVRKENQSDSNFRWIFIVDKK